MPSVSHGAGPGFPRVKLDSSALPQEIEGLACKAAMGNMYVVLTVCQARVNLSNITTPFGKHHYQSHFIDEEMEMQTC